VSPLWEIAAKIGLSALLAGLIGAEREMTGKWAGLRTHMLIAVGSALLTHVSILIGVEYAEGRSNAWDPGRIAAQIVSGVGFIGAGTIIQSRGAVHGLTTAAGLWVASGLGIAVGGGFFAEAVLTTVALLVILIVLRPFEARVLRGTRTVVLQLRQGQKLSQVMETLEEAKIQPEQVSMAQGEEGISATVSFRGSAEDSRRLIQVAGRENLLASEDDDGEGRRGPFP
jgi:putative Mg2+ transporter-C (MgtC) family protein